LITEKDRQFFRMMDSKDNAVAPPTLKPWKVDKFSIVFDTERSNSSQELSKRWAPNLQVVETPNRNKLIITADIPGLKLDEVQTLNNKNDIVISGERKQSCPTGSSLVIAEIPYGKFSKRVVIPEIYNSKFEDIALENGVLTITYSRYDPTKKEKKLTCKECQKPAFRILLVQKLKEDKLPSLLCPKCVKENSQSYLLEQLNRDSNL